MHCHDGHRPHASRQRRVCPLRACRIETTNRWQCTPQTALPVSARRRAVQTGRRWQETMLIQRRAAALAAPWLLLPWRRLMSRRSCSCQRRPGRLQGDDSTTSAPAARDLVRLERQRPSWLSRVQRWNYRCRHLPETLALAPAGPMSLPTATAYPSAAARMSRLPSWLDCRFVMPACQPLRLGTLRDFALLVAERRCRYRRQLRPRAQPLP